MASFENLTVLFRSFSNPINKVMLR
ncbi:hypothetical protein RU639_013841 [Aspergillus parasiticus]